MEIAEDRIQQRASGPANGVCALL